MSRASQRLRRVFERRYHIAMAVLAVAVTVTFAASFRVAMVEEDRASLVIMATEQRALSQRVAFLIKDIDRRSEPAHVEFLREELLITVARMRRTHRTLAGIAKVNDNTKRLITPLEGIYFGGYTPFNDRVQTFLEDAEMIAGIDPFAPAWDQSAPQREAIVTAATTSLMQTHGLMLKILEAKAARDVTMAKWLDVVFWVGTLVLILLVRWVIFHPMSRQIQVAFEEVEGAKSQAKRAEDEAVAANEAKGHFFQAASHELKTPLNAILGMADSIKEREVAGLEEELNQMTVAGDHLLSMLNNILDTHRISQGGLTLQSSSFNLAETLTRTINLAAALADQKSLSFKSQIDVPKTCQVMGDPERLEQVLNNLLDNAVKFTTKGGVTIDAFVDEDPNNRAGLNVAIGDTGAGIPANRRDAIFEKFSSEGSMLSGNGGLGVGLALSRELVEMMGGSIDVDSEVGKGSTFLLHIPMEIPEGSTLTVEPTPSATPKETSPVDKKLPPRPSRREFNVLVVDDNMANRMVAEALVKPLGGRPVMAVDGRQAVMKADEFAYDVILMDISMPVMDGIEATRTIRAGTGLSKRTPIIAVTAHATGNDLSDLKATGFNDLITKPVRKDSLTHCIEKWTTRKIIEKETAS